MTRSSRSGNNNQAASGSTSTPQRQSGRNASTPGRTTPIGITGNNSSLTGNGNTPNTFIPSKYDPPELDEDGQNYDLWSKALRLGFESRGIWRIVNGTELAPDETIDATAHETWCLKDKEAQVMLLKALKHQGQKCIYRAETAKESWDLLRARYSGGNDRRKASLFERVLSTNLTDSEPLQQQIDAIIYAADQLDSAGENIPDSVLGYILINRLPSSYSTLRTVLTSYDSPNFSSNWVADQIIAEEQHRIAESGNSAASFFANAKRGPNRNNKKCSYCDKRGHDVSDCWEKNGNGPKCSYCGIKNHEASECRKKKRDDDKDKNNDTSTTSTSGASTSAKANVAIAEYETIRILDPSDDDDDDFYPITCALVAHAQEEPLDDDNHHTSDADECVIKLLDDDEGFPSVDISSHSQFKQALANNTQQISELTKLVKALLQRAEVQTSKAKYQRDVLKSAEEGTHNDDTRQTIKANDAAHNQPKSTPTTTHQRTLTIMGSEPSQCPSEFDQDLPMSPERSNIKHIGLAMEDG